ncbi:hypothetical protein WN51_13129 [Melipona quadrifasciata]|uniref:Uncharacterized protein n=1 Tax=Melipona quadrifasciata TaxID=166423 RepID=A0A0N1ITL7_9HYME|nr:hypothetical protein WN51_13129 [Melipona quadrifasciata]
MAGGTLCWVTLGTNAARRRGTSVLTAPCAARRHPTFINISGVCTLRNLSPSLSSIKPLSAFFHQDQQPNRLKLDRSIKKVSESN